MKDLKKFLKKDGHILITVPAYQFLFSKKDEVLGHYRRYNKKLLKKDLALAYIDKALAINYELDNNSKIIETQILKSYLLLDTKPAQARNLSEKSLQLLKPENSNKIKADLYKLLYECYKRSNQTNRALSMFEKHTVFKDSFQLEKNKILIIKYLISDMGNTYQDKITEIQSNNSFLKKFSILSGLPIISITSLRDEPTSNFLSGLFWRLDNLRIPKFSHAITLFS